MLTTVQIRALKPAARPFKVPDSDGLFLLVQPTGALLWRFRYKILGVERKMSLGTFPDVSLKDARKKRDALRAEIVDGVDPVEEKRQRRLKDELAAATTFTLVAEEFIQKMEREGKSPATIKKVAVEHRKVPVQEARYSQFAKSWGACTMWGDVTPVFSTSWS